MDTHFEGFLKTGRYLRSWSPKTVDIYTRSYECFLRFRQRWGWRCWRRATRNSLL